MMELTDIDIVADTLANAQASGMTIGDCLKLIEHAHCLLCWNEAINIYGVEGIDPKRHQITIDFGTHQ